MLTKDAPSVVDGADLTVRKTVLCPHCGEIHGSEQVTLKHSFFVAMHKLAPSSFYYTSVDGEQMANWHNWNIYCECPCKA